MALTIDSSCAEAWEEVLSDDSDTSFVLCCYDGNSLMVRQKGAGGLAAFKEHLPADEVAFGGFRCVGVDDRGSTVSRRNKFIFVSYVPPGAPVMKRARAGQHKGQVVDRAFRAVHVEVQIEQAEDLTEDDITTRLRASGGAHQPTHYEF
eukprot:EC791486.1.p2 GENE.EC791486.1~~EC791486.1.p2  ORF type:complete len:149 (+),score=52.14 EC791486.1:23-469(+)